MPIMRYTLLLISLVLLNNGYAQVSSKSIKTFDSFVKDGINLWEPPALAVTVVKDGEPVFTKAYGIGNVNEHNEVNENTLFLCASTTKAFTAAALAILVDDGTVNWD